MLKAKFKNQTKTSLTLEKEMYIKIRLLAVKKDTTSGDIIRTAVKKYLEENKNLLKN